MGWSADQAATYLRDEWPFDSLGHEQAWAADLASSPGGLEAYPIGALQYEAVRKRAQDALGPRFDSVNIIRCFFQTGHCRFRL